MTARRQPGAASRGHASAGSRRKGRARRAAPDRAADASHRAVDPRPVLARAGGLTVSEVDRLDDLRRELQRATRGAPPRWDADADDVRRSVAHLVLTLVEFLRQLLERQAVRRMEAGTLTPREVEALGQALMTLEDTVREIAGTFGLELDELNLDLGPLGPLR